jgi:hypothetical protein
MRRRKYPGCCYCWSLIDELCTDAHVHGIGLTVRLCWNCHRAYDHDLMNTREVLEARRRFEREPPPLPRIDELHRDWKERLETHKLKWNTRFHLDKKYRQAMAIDRNEIVQEKDIFGNPGRWVSRFFPHW